MHILVWKAACGISRAGREAAALEKQDTDASLGNMMEGLEEYASCRTALCEKIYNEEITTAMRDVLPEEDQGAYLIADLLEETKAQRYPEAVEDVRRLKDMLPGLGGIMKHYLKWLNGQMEQQKEEAGQARNEFQILAGQIKAKIYALMEAGQYQAALSIAEQIGTLLPEDPEIIGMKEKISREL